MSQSLNNQLNQLLANTAIEQHKLQSFHWYVKGSDFFQVHAKLEELYDYFADMVDDIAELILINEGSPLSSAKEFLEQATISERSDSFVASSEVFTAVIQDFEAFLSEVSSIKQAADAEDNYLVSAKMDAYIENFSKSLWMLKQMQK